MTELRNYILTLEDFWDSKERQQLMKTCWEHSESDLKKGNQTLAFRLC